MMHDILSRKPDRLKFAGKTANASSGAGVIKRVAIFQIRSLRFQFLFFTHVVIPKPVPTFGRHALVPALSRKPDQKEKNAIAYYEKPALKLARFCLSTGTNLRHPGKAPVAASYEKSY
ncbi:hypothetical protein [Falsochrobactrum shanghaiense]|uniref:hypothetical protein n=1 Tax=Falsochrobactrum shanghaiense TaxID=2201899 RepID=UPI0018EE62AB|nr:hypothetical protein [Falsochrobactrum shanghaiense]